MRGDYSRFTYDSKKHYSSVRMQQGRLQLDSDWNEAQDIRLHHERMLALDAIGPAGAPRDSAGFMLSYVKERDDFLIGRGRYYVDGILCENDGDIFYSEQPHSLKKISDLADGRYIAYLDVWESAVSAIEDPDIREIALGGPDTTSRFKVMWRLDIEPFSGQMHCDAKSRSQARMAAKIERGRASSKDNGPCSSSINDGYGYLGNNLYRVEIHDGGSQAAATFKWSRDNCSIIRAVQSIDKKTITILDPARNAGQIFHPGQFVEITNDERELKGENGEFARIESIDDLRLTLNREISPQSFEPNPKVLLWDGEPRPIGYDGGWIKAVVRGDRALFLLPDETLAPVIFEPGCLVEISGDSPEERGRFLCAQVESITSSSDGISLNLTDIKGDLALDKQNLKVRKWDPDDEWMDLEMDIKVAFSKGDEYRKGDYWLIPSREMTGRIIWPRDCNGQPEFMPRQGVFHHMAKIADLLHDDQGWRLIDQRNIFSKLQSILAVAYGGGDGQQGWPGEVLENPFQIIVTYDGKAAGGKEVSFKIVKGEGKLMPDPGSAGSTEATIKSDERGIARCYCRIESHEIVVDASLAVSEVGAGSACPMTIPPQRFRADCLDAGKVGYRLPSAYPELGESKTVKEALDRLSILGRADNVIYSPPEEGRGSEGIKTVGEALDDLYNTAPSSSCAASIGKGGQYLKLDEAVQRMMEQGKNDICLCLLPGNHSLPEGLRLEGRERIKESINLSIRGLGAGSKIVVDDGQHILLEGLHSLHLKDLEIEGRGQGDGLLSFNNIDLLSIQGCIIRATGKGDVAVAIRNGEGIITLNGNQIEGTLCLYEGNACGAFSFDSEQADSLKRRVCHLLSRVRRGDLTLCNNQITRISVGSGMADRIKEQLAKKHEGKPSELKDIFRVIFLSNNVIADGPNLLLAGNLIMSGNFFERQADGRQAGEVQVMNWAISGKSVFTGNIGEETTISVVASESNDAANLLDIKKL